MIGDSGQGIKRPKSADVKTPSQQASHTEIISKLLTAGNTQYTNEPSIPHQRDRFPGTWKDGHVQMDVFDVVVPDEKERLNALLAEAHPPESPKIVMIGQKEYPPTDDGKLMVTLWFRRVLYLNLDAKQWEQLSNSTS